jgi:hypothetical protein
MDPIDPHWIVATQLGDSIADGHSTGCGPSCRRDGSESLVDIRCLQRAWAVAPTRCVSILRTLPVAFAPLHFASYGWAETSFLDQPDSDQYV